MNNKHKITVALTTCLLTAPAVMAGAWFAGCTLRTWTKWDTNVGWNNNIPNPAVMCVIPGYYYSEPNSFVPTCTGRLYQAGFCDSEKWSWGCDPKDLKGWGTERRLEGQCVQELNPDGSMKKFYVPCLDIGVFGVVKTAKAQCDGR
ncbi:MAG: hypothetical protein NTX70_07170 [Verrucomicrobia bacterium]|nr:hypothetical protein [Verrucomicrobiota bacterium]